ncbi:FAD-binding oxidoreductase [Catenuloplanes atrovinosus]|uniref:FAD/FMN-containing dehydrogenase n=1 Tax=Catenuloplanes atrovinosus TaxID=137266 RepID=A0AAE3YR92_9ACTN|nr:FAD-binding oxidoreductase [Catenuloplanes atrovinosus]MDR7277777.1 FAD/FMN-containing dehydrogenase [Catenuloplanes atrovinosus]
MSEHGIDEAAVAALAATVTGLVAAPGDAGFDEECATYNPYTPMRPAVVVGAASGRDVAAAIRFAGEHGLPVATLTTGHQVRGADGAVLINLRRLNRVTVDVDARTARIGGGALWSEVLAVTTPAGLAPVNGSAPHVGATGYLLGGGHSPTLGRLYGYGADTVRSVEIVTADGNARRVTADSDPDLFFAVRGGKGNFGVVTALEVELFPVTRFYGGAVFVAGEHAPTLLHAWRTWAPALPESATTSVAVQRLPPDPALPEPLRGAFVVALRFAFIGDAAEGERVFAPMRGAAPILVDGVRDRPYAEVGLIHTDPPGPLPYVDRTTGLRDLPAEAVDALLALVGPGTGCPLVSVELRALGGALDRRPEPPNAVATRGMPFVLFGFGVGGPEALPQLRGYLGRVLDAVSPWAHGRQMANFLSAVDEGATPAEVRAAYGDEIYDRLSKIKQVYDPGNLFRANHNIPPA